MKTEEASGLEYWGLAVVGHTTQIIAKVSFPPWTDTPD